MTLPAASASRPALRLLVVDDHEIVRQGLVSLLARREGFRVVGEAGTVAQAIAAARTSEPDLIVMDVRLPDGSGIEACRVIRAAQPRVRVVILTGYADPAVLIDSIVAGASGYLLKQSRGRDLVAALEAVGRGESLLDPAVTGPVLERIRRAASGTATDELATLTPRQRTILLHVAEGRTNRQIAAELVLPLPTVKHAVSAILAKLHLQRRTQAAAVVAHRGLSAGR